ncbi:MAG TPA: hypothetical protein DCF42_08720 [Lachnospiraceae bacterium]|nr:hypothetical protein [Lachnospiraceae bacterium]
MTDAEMDWRIAAEAERRADAEADRRIAGETDRMIAGEADLRYLRRCGEKTRMIYWIQTGKR